MKQIVFKYILFLFLIAGQWYNTFAQKTAKRPDSWAVKVENNYLKNLWKINDTLYRSEQPDDIDFAYIQEIGIKSILNLRSQHIDKKSFGDLKLKEYKVEMEADNFSEKEIIDALKVIQAAPKPLLVHCVHGSDRTGVVIAMYRIVYQNWTKEEALKEMQEGGYGFHATYTNIIDYIKNVDVEKIKKKTGKKN